MAKTNEKQTNPKPNSLIHWKYIWALVYFCGFVVVVVTFVWASSHKNVFSVPIQTNLSDKSQRGDLNMMAPIASRVWMLVPQEVVLLGDVAFLE